MYTFTSTAILFFLFNRISLNPLVRFAQSGSNGNDKKMKKEKKKGKRKGKKKEERKNHSREKYNMNRKVYM